jgi:hypothetical protein
MPMMTGESTITMMNIPPSTTRKTPKQNHHLFPDQEVPDSECMHVHTVVIHAQYHQPNISLEAII